MGRTIKIAIADHVGKKAGMDYYTGLLAEGMSRHVSSVAVFSNFGRQEKNIHFYHFFIGHTHSRVKKMFNHFIAFLRTAVMCRLHSYNTVIVHLFSYGLKDVYALAVLKMFGLKVISIVHDVESFAGADDQRLQKFILGPLSDKLMVHNEFSLDILSGKFGRIAACKTKVIPHGNFHSLPAGDFGKQEARKLLSLDEDTTYLLFFGQIKEVKGLEILIKAMVHVPEEIKLIIAGKPWKSDFQPYQNLIEKLGLNERIEKRIGFVADEQRDQLFKACDVLVLPYKQIFQSGVMLMAISYKIVVVASDLAPMRELIRHGETGFLFQSENEVSLAENIMTALGSPSASAGIADRAWRETAQTNNWDRIAEKIVNW